MKSEWKITSNYIGDTKMYSVYRQLNTAEVDHSGNREYACGYTTNRDDCVRLAKRLNEGGNS